MTDLVPYGYDHRCTYESRLVYNLVVLLLPSRYPGRSLSLPTFLCRHLFLCLLSEPQAHTGSCLLRSLAYRQCRLSYNNWHPHSQGLKNRMLVLIHPLRHFHCSLLYHPSLLHFPAAYALPCALPFPLLLPEPFFRMLLDL